MKRFMPELRDFYETSYDCAKNILTGMAPDGYTYYIYSGRQLFLIAMRPFAVWIVQMVVEVQRIDLLGGLRIIIDY